MPPDAPPPTFPPPWEFRRSPAAAAILVETGTAHGLTAEACLRGSGLSAGDLLDASGQIEARQELAIVRNLLAGLGDRPGLGCDAGERHTLGTTGVLGYALLSSPTLREGIEVALRFLALSPAFLRPALREDGGLATVVLDDRDVPADVRGFLLERDLAAIGKLMPVLFGGRGPTGAVTLEVRIKGGARLRAALPVARILFDRPHNVLTFPARLLDHPLPAADPHIARICQDQCRELLDRRGRDGTAAAVRARLLARSPVPPGMDAVAAELGVSPRTLHRRLAREGTSFRAIREGVLRALAADLLVTTGLTVEQVARRLGYAETAAFTHAFSRWHGVPPSRYRSEAGRDG